MAKPGSNIYKRKDGRYEGRILTGHTVYRKPRYIYVYARTLRSVRQKMEQARVKLQKGEYCGCIQMGTAAAEWLSLNKKRWKPTTLDTYNRALDSYILPVLGEYSLDRIDRVVLQEFSEEIERLSDQKALSEKYKKYICSIVRRIIRFENELRNLNLALPALPEFRISGDKIQLPEEEQLLRLEGYLVEHVNEDTCLGILLARYTGIRIGELCALQWKDIDLEQGLLRIQKNLQRIKFATEGGEQAASRTKVCSQMPKTKESVRTIPLPNGLTELLMSHRKGPEHYLISGRRSDWAEVRTVQYRFASILKKAGCKPFHFHLLRHAFASECIRKGCDIKGLSEILGHSNVQITMNIYVHISMQQKKNMMNQICMLRVK